MDHHAFPDLEPERGILLLLERHQGYYLADIPLCFSSMYPGSRHPRLLGYPRYLSCSDCYIMSFDNLRCSLANAWIQACLFRNGREDGCRSYKARK